MLNTFGYIVDQNKNKTAEFKTRYGKLIIRNLGIFWIQTDSENRVQFSFTSFRENLK